MKTRSWFIFRVMVVVCSVVALGAVVLMLSAQSKEEVSKTVWNDPTMLTGPDGRPRWEKYAPTVDDPDRPCVVTSPPGAEVESCMGWMRRVVNPGVLPAELRSHLLALKRWPEYGGEDVFVTWYVTGARLIHIVEGNADLTVFTVLLAKEPAETTLDDHVGLAVRVAESVLTSEMLPHPESGAHRYTRSAVPGVTAGSWLTAALDLSRDAEGRLTMVTPSSPTGRVVRFLTDGEFVRLQVIKVYPGPRMFEDRSRARFEPTTPRPPKDTEHQPKLVIPTVEPASEPEDQENEWNWNNHALVLIPEEARAAVASHARYSDFGTFDFPNEEEQVAHAPQEPPNAATLEYCVDWITRTVRPTWVPPDLSSHLIPVKAWANGRDAFVVRYVLNEHAVQIIHTRSETTVVVAPLGDVLRKPAEAHAELMRKTIVEVLSVAPPARVNSSPVGNVTLGLCQLNTEDMDRDPMLAVWEMDRGPILAVSAATDGRFVAMRAIKCFGPATPRPPIINAPLFDVPPAPPQEDTERQPKLVIPTLESASEPEDQENE